MVAIALGHAAHKRTATGSPEIRCFNRYFEHDPTNEVDQMALLARCGTASLVAPGIAAIRGIFHQKGVFADSLFFSSGTALYRLPTSGSAQLITGALSGSGETSFGVMAGDGYTNLFVGDGNVLHYYTGGTHAVGTLTVATASPPYISTQVVQVGATYYTWSASVDGGSPAGTSANPYRVLLGSNDTTSLENLAAAINFDGVRGVDFSAAMTGPNASVRASSTTATTCVVTALADDTTGNSIASTIFSGSNLTWGGATLSAGGTHTLHDVPIPEGFGVQSIAAIASHILVATNVPSPGASQRVYFIRPGEVGIDPLAYFSAESEPDQIVKIIAMGAEAWLIGQTTFEPWYASGDLDPPFLPVAGRTLSIGAVPGTACKVGANEIMFVGHDGLVYSTLGGGKPIGNNSMSERIRLQIVNGVITSNTPAWSFSLDGHIFYVLNLGAGGTVCYDKTTNQWCEFGTTGYTAWNMHRGTMWNGRIVAGDVSTPTVWEMLATATQDQASIDITHITTGHVATRKQDQIPMDAAYLTASAGFLGKNGAIINLRFSDDNGHTWSAYYPITLVQASYSQTLQWLSLGSFSSPGRVIEISDTGGVITISGANTIIDGGDEE